AVRYFSYLPESLDAYSTDPELATRVRLYRGGGWHPWAYAFAMPFRYRIAFRGCAILRVFQVTGVIPALIAKRRFGVPFVTTYGFWYARLAHSSRTGALRRLVEALGLKAADAVIVPTRELSAHAPARVAAVGSPRRSCPSSTTGASPRTWPTPTRSCCRPTPKGTRRRCSRR